MNEISITTKQLPEALPELAKFALVGREKLAAVRAEINAIQKVGLAKEVLEQKRAEAQEIADPVTLSEVKIGRMLKDIPKVEHKGNQYTGRMETSNKAEESKTKTETVAELGFSKDQVSQFQQMADHEEIVHEAIAEAKENNDIVSRTEVLRRIKHDKEIKAIEKSDDEVLKEGDNQYTKRPSSNLNEGSDPIRTSAEVAAKIGVSENTYRDMKFIKEHGSMEQIERMDKGGRGEWSEQNSERN